MTKQEIITKCIEAYTEAIEVCKQFDLYDAKYWLDAKFLDLGVCCYSRNALNFEIGNQKWIVRNFIPFKLHWAKRPYDCGTHKELMQSLQTRLDILKRELEIPE